MWVEYKSGIYATWCHFLYVSYVMHVFIVSVVRFAVFHKAVCDVVDFQHLLVILFLHSGVDSPGYHLHPSLCPVLDIIPADSTPKCTHTHKTISFQFCPCWSYMQSEKLTVRQSSSEWGRLRRHRASTVRDGAPSPTGRPLVLTRNVSIRMKSAGRRFPAYSGSTDDGSAPWPRLGRSVSSGVEHSRWNHVSCS